MVKLKNPRLKGKDLIYDIKIVEGTVPQAAGAAVLFIDIFGFWRRNIRRVAIVGTAAAVTTAAVPPASAERGAAAQQAAAASRSNGNLQLTRRRRRQPESTKKLEQLKALLNEGLITQAQYQKASQQVLNEMVK